jgi:hypothetical protein
MGLDLVELVLDTEETFGIRINDDDAASIHTPGELAEYVAAQVSAAWAGACHSRICFYRLRSALMAIWDAPRKKIRPATPLAELMPQDESLPERWARLDAALGARMFPKPAYPPGLKKWIIAIECAPSFLLPVCAAWRHWSPLPSFLATMLVFFLVAFFTERRFRHKRIFIPKGFQTVADILPYVPSSAATWTRADILEVILMLTSKHSGVPRSEIRADSRFVQDLGMS